MHTQTDVVARLCGAVKRYGSLTALDGVDLVLQRGELLAVLGPNGAGKSTSISLLLGLMEPDQGRAELFGMDPVQIDACRRIGVMLQSAMLPATLQVGELLRLVSSYYPNPRPLEESAALAGVGDLLKRPYGKLSGGQQRRVQFALALCGRPELLFLDEPTVGMDIDARRKLWAAMRALVAEGCSVVLTTHYLEEAEALAQRVIVMAKGRVLSDGSVDALRARVPLTHIRCVTDLHADVIANWPQVVSAERDGTRMRISTSAAEHVLRRLLDADASLSELEVQRASLADAFTALTNEETVEQEAA
ncbi:ABC transporter ATP-binding protein [Dyella monticola]|uniref:ABC transporter ATP-binding protein n=1 Tax=Dyella monticola TaxID=1927958 RepID=A0A370X8V7_9GAMM|nr:ABC transporter ATP-binding protein [Dyella monticola]RDS84700.1 ABC transporter ATP-binding protein [Dyella monticola]